MAYEAGHLPRWLAHELWIVELEGDVHEREFSVVADRGRLAERVLGGTWPRRRASSARSSNAIEPDVRSDGR